jgi:hypothetical protein
MNKISVGYTKLFYSNSGFAIMFISSPHSLMISWDLGCFAPIHYYPNQLPLTWTFITVAPGYTILYIYIQSAEASINSYPVLCIVYIFFNLSISIINHYNIYLSQERFCRFLIHPEAPSPPIAQPSPSAPAPCGATLQGLLKPQALPETLRDAVEQKNDFKEQTGDTWGILCTNFIKL